MTDRLQQLQQNHQQQLAFCQQQSASSAPPRSIRAHEKSRAQDAATPTATSMLHLLLLLLNPTQLTCASPAPAHDHPSWFSGPIRPPSLPSSSVGDQDARRPPLAFQSQPSSSGGGSDRSTPSSSRSASSSSSIVQQPVAQQPLLLPAVQSEPSPPRSHSVSAHGGAPPSTSTPIPSVPPISTLPQPSSSSFTSQPSSLSSTQAQQRPTLRSQSSSSASATQPAAPPSKRPKLTR
ncbi:hypothetical protein CVT26_007547 [Gymnopilus dilepis]|uniref:Uncharacterized protein n=1 Tax=Gymnopilus dilepis TaxID=231916 RepID=A0A409WWN8_9AGAR|nr:hypothetical protein CVT26_007547 [Gymnopilus dilepis]